jgi:hypothetical protein
MKFTRRSRLGLLAFLGVVPPSLAIFLLKYTITASTPPAIQAAIAGGIITGIGTVSSAIYKEVSSYFQQTDSNVDKKVTLITPLVQKYYNPWINSAKILHAELETVADNPSPGSDDIETLLYGMMVYYGYRMKFILEAGGTILLSSTTQQDAVFTAYKNTETALNWTFSPTLKKYVSSHEEVSYLQWLFLTKNSSGNGAAAPPKPPQKPADGSTDSSKDASPAKSPENKPADASTDPSKNASLAQVGPYLFFQFKGEIPGDPMLPQMVETLSLWAKDKSRVRNASYMVKTFADTFETSIDQLYTAWGQ